MFKKKQNNDDRLLGLAKERRDFWKNNYKSLPDSKYKECLFAIDVLTTAASKGGGHDYIFEDLAMGLARLVVEHMKEDLKISCQSKNKDI